MQGVGYRASCAQRARAAGVGGTVRNLSDGRVEAVFEGAPDAVDALVEWCEHGPAYAHVRHVTVYDEHPLGDPAFTIT